MYHVISKKLLLITKETGSLYFGACKKKKLFWEMSFELYMIILCKTRCVW